MASLQGLGHAHPLELKTAPFEDLTLFSPVLRHCSHVASGSHAYTQVFFSKSSEKLGYFPISCTESQ